jgi:hypothetical protein
MIKQWRSSWPGSSGATTQVSVRALHMPSCLDGFCRPLVPRQQLVDSIDWVSIDHSLEHVAQVGIGLDVVELGGFDERVDGGGASTAFVRGGFIMPGF